MSVTPPRARFAEYAAQVVTSPYGRPVESSQGHSRSDTSLSSVNAQLLTHCWVKKPINLDGLEAQERTDLLVLLFELLGSSTSNLSTLDALNARHRTLSYEHERLAKQHAQVRSANTRLQAELAGWKARYTDLEKIQREEEAKVKELREEVSRGRKALEGVRIAASHESKKTQLKLDKANAQLAKLSNDASLLSRPHGLVLLNAIPGGRATSPVAPTQHALLEQSVKDLAEIRRSLQEETEAFRHVVVSTGNQLREVLAAAEGKEEPERVLHGQFFSVSPRDPLHRSLIHQAASSTAHPTIADAKLKALISDVRRKLLSDAPRSIAQATSDGLPPVDSEELKRQERERAREKQELEDRVKDLEVEVVCAQAREEEAKKLVDEMTALQAASVISCAGYRERRQKQLTPSSAMRAAQLKNEANDPSDPHSELYEQKRMLDEERRKFAEAAVRLGQERRQLEVEREAFLEERRQVDTESILALLPPTPTNTSPHKEAEVVVEEPVETGMASLLTLPQTPRAKHKHHPSAPSPLSGVISPGLKPRTPRHHSVGKKRKTPLSRLVLEKAVRKGKEVSQPTTSRPSVQLSGAILGEGGRRGNASIGQPTRILSGGGEKVCMSRSTMKRDSSGSSSSSSSSTSTFRAGTSTFRAGTSTIPPSHREPIARKASVNTLNTLKTSASLAQSVKKDEEPRRMSGRDLSKVDGIGPRGMTAKPKPWR